MVIKSLNNLDVNDLMSHKLFGHQEPDGNITWSSDIINEATGNTTHLTKHVPDLSLSELKSKYNLNNEQMTELTQRMKWYEMIGPAAYENNFNAVETASELKNRFYEPKVDAPKLKTDVSNASKVAASISNYKAPIIIGGIVLGGIALGALLDKNQ